VTKRSAALALVRGDGAAREVLLVHPGGPFWAKKDVGAWSLPKGELEDGEDPLTAARREFEEETGHAPPTGPFVDLGEVVQKSGKHVRAFAARGEFDVQALRSNEVEVEHPAKSGRVLRFPEVDRATWATLERARVLLNPAQVPLVERALTASV
jgi:predicted NUDIX family NTP pyrophosphohydrolase